MLGLDRTNGGLAALGWETCQGLWAVGTWLHSDAQRGHGLTFAQCRSVSAILGPPGVPGVTESGSELRKPHPLGHRLALSGLASSPIGG